MTIDGSAIRVLRCRSGTLEWAISDEALREVAPMAPATRVPGAPPAFLGVVNIRGALLPAADTRLLLGQGVDREPGALVIVMAAGRRVALAVDDVDDLELVSIEDLEPPPERAVPDRAIIALVREPRPMLLIDAEALVAPLFAATPGPT